VALLTVLHNVAKPVAKSAKKPGKDMIVTRTNAGDIFQHSKDIFKEKSAKNHLQNEPKVKKLKRKK